MDQEALWRGEFGDAYIARNTPSDDKLASLTRHWAAVLRGTTGAPPADILEVGANIGLNLMALRRLTTARLIAVEPNATARARLADSGVADQALDGIAARIPLPDAGVDLAFTSGVLIHIHPDQLEASCREILRVSRRYVVCIEYFSDKPEEVLYRGHAQALFKRDFGGFWMDLAPELRLLDYGFAWKRATGLDNLTWQLFEKPQ